MSKKINETKTKSLTKEQKACLLHSVIKYLASHGLPKTLQQILSEAQIEGEQWKSSPVDLEELYCKYLDACYIYTVASSSSSSITATNKLCPKDNKHKLLPTKGKGHTCEACKDVIYGIGSELMCKKCDPEGSIYFHDFCVGACPSVKYRFDTDDQTGHRRILSLTHERVTPGLKCNGCRGDIKGSRYTGGKYDLHPECAVNLVESATNNLGVDAEKMKKIYSKFKIKKHVYDNMRSELHKLLPSNVKCNICNQHNTGKSPSEYEWSCVTTCQGKSLGWHLGCVRRRLIAPKKKSAITIDTAGSAGGKNKIGLEDVLELLMEVGIGFLPLPPPISILLAIGFKVVAYHYTVLKE